MDFHAILARGLDKNGIDPNHLDLNTTNSTLIGMQRKYCKLGECPIDWATITYRPNLGGNIVYMACFIVLLVAHLFYGIRHKTWGYMSTICLGLLGEIIGYLGRVMLYENPFIQNNFLTYLICLTIAPAFFTAAIYICLGRVITAIGPEYSRLSPKMYTYIFVGFDVLALVLQSIGGAIASMAKDKKGSDLGTHTMVGGLVCQVISIAIFMAIWVDFALRARRARMSGALARTQPPLYDSLRRSKNFTGFQAAIALATFLIFIRSIYRAAELAGGFKGHLANDEVSFMILEGPMIIIAILGMTIFHPGRVFGSLWNAAGAGTRSQKMMGSSASSVELNEEWKSQAQTGYRQV